MKTDRCAKGSRKRLILGALLALAIIAAPSVTYAIQVRGQVTTLSDTTNAATDVTYSFGDYRTRNNEQAEQVQVTFPAGTDVSGATAISPAGTTSVSGQTVTVVFAAPIGGLTDFSIILGGITNPTQSAIYNVGDLTVTLTNKWGTSFTEALPTADYTIAGAMLSITVDSSTLDFGTLLPDEMPPAKTINVTVVADMPYLMSRTISGDSGALGLAVNGSAQGPKPAGTDSYVESVSVTPGWDAPADTTLTATIMYSVTP